MCPQFSPPENRRCIETLWLLETEPTIENEKSERTALNIFGKEADLGGNLFHKQRVYHQKSINIQQSFRFSRRVTLYREVLINVNRNLKKAVYKYRRRSFSISLNFYQTILESSPQTRFMFDIKKL